MQEVACNTSCSGLFDTSFSVIYTAYLFHAGSNGSHAVGKMPYFSGDCGMPLPWWFRENRADSRVVLALAPLGSGFGIAPTAVVRKRSVLAAGSRHLMPWSRRRCGSVRVCVRFAWSSGTRGWCAGGD